MTNFTYTCPTNQVPERIPLEFWRHWHNCKEGDNVPAMAALRFCRDNRPPEDSSLTVFHWDESTPTYKSGNPKQVNRIEFNVRIDRHATA